MINSRAAHLDNLSTRALYNNHVRMDTCVRHIMFCITINGNIFGYRVFVVIRLKPVVCCHIINILFSVCVLIILSRHNSLL